jgi:hypothetical protein
MVTESSSFLSLAGIVPALDVVKDICSGLGFGPVRPAVYSLAFEPAKKLSAAVLSAQLPTALILQVT